MDEDPDVDVEESATTTEDMGKWPSGHGISKDYSGHGRGVGKMTPGDDSHT